MVGESVITATAPARMSWLAADTIGVIARHDASAGRKNEVNGMTHFADNRGFPGTFCDGKSALEIGFEKVGIFLHFSCTTVQVVDAEWSG